MKKDLFTKKTKIFFDKRAELYEKANLLKTSKAGGIEFEKFYRFLDLSPKANLIDLGAGYGRWVLPLLQLGHKVTAVDISRKSLGVINKEAEKHNLEKNLKIVESDFNKPVFHNVYDGAYCISTFHLLAGIEEERINILSNLVKAVKKGGTILLIEPNPLNPFFYPFYFFSSQVDWKVEKHFLRSTERNLRNIFRKLSIGETKVEYFGFFPLRFINTFQPTALLNKFVNETPFIKKFSSFLYIKGIKL